MTSGPYEIAVVGAGPAGCALALHLARTGRRVLLVDGKRVARGKTCGEGLMPAGVQELEGLGLGALVEHGQRFEGVRFRLAGGEQAQASFPGGARGLGLARPLLDAGLLEAAQAEPGVEVRLGTWVREVVLSPPGSGEAARLRVGEAWVEARVLVGADGCRSSLRRLAGFEAPTPKLARFGVSGHFARSPTTQDPFVEVYVGSGWELYTTPVGGALTNVALLLGRERLRALQGRLEPGLRELLREAGGRCEELAEGEVRSPVRALGPLALQATRAHGEAFLLVGDAAGGLDPITGEGLSLALHTSRVAAEILDAALSEGDLSSGRLALWTRERGRAARTLKGLTTALLFLAGRPRHARRVVRGLARNPETLERLLGVASGLRPLSSLRARDGLRLLVGA